MGSYIPATGEERQAMLQAIGLTSVEELFDVVPEAGPGKESGPARGPE